MRGNEYPVCIECLGAIRPNEHRVNLAAPEDPELLRHELCDDLANFLRLNFKSGRTLAYGQLLQGWDNIARFYARMNVRDLPNAYMRGKEMYDAILKARKKKKG